MRRATLLLTIAIAVPGCKAPDPQALLQVSDVESYWTVDPSRGTTNYLAPAVRFKVTNRSDGPTRSIQATATFRRKKKLDETWGSDWQEITRAGNPLQPGRDVQVLLKSDARYSLNDAPPEAFFQNPEFGDVTVEVFLRVGPSSWSKFAAVDVPRQLGTRSVEAFTSAGRPSPAAP
jgi:hypothetical protein